MNQARLRIWPDLPRGRIPTTLYGHSAEHVGRCVYEGLWVGSRSRIPNEGGVRLDVIAALKQLRAPLLRWPGRTFGGSYQWRDGVGPVKERPVRLNAPWQQTESNGFGTDEFLRLCEAVGCAPWLGFDTGATTPSEAAAWAEYCCGVADTALTRMRATHGHPEPYDVRYWSMGNWERGALSDGRGDARAYAQIGARLKALNESLELVAGDGPAPCAETWRHDVCEALSGAALIDHLTLSRHFTRGPGAEFGVTDYDALFADLTAFEQDIVRAEHLLAYFFPERSVGIAVEEWGMQHPEASPETGMEQPNTLRDAVFAGAMLNLLNRHAERVTLATLCQSVNALQCLAVTDEERLYLTPTYYTFDMMRRHMGAQALTAELECGSREVIASGCAKPQQVADLSVSASLTGKTVLVTVANQQATDDVELVIELQGTGAANATGRVLAADSPNAANGFEQPRRVIPKRVGVATDGGAVTHLLSPHSFTAIRITLAG